MATNASKVIPVDFARRRSGFLTLRDRAGLRSAHQPFDESAHWNRCMRTEFRGGFVLGFIWGFGLPAFFWLLNLWVDVGGAP